MLEPKKHGFCLAKISRVQGSSKRVTPKALVAFTTADDWTCGVLSCYLDMCLMPHGCMCLMAVLILVLGVSSTIWY